MKKILILLLVIANISFAQTGQDDPDINWKKIETDHFRIVFPDYVEKQAQYIHNLLEYYRSVVGKSYDFPPKKFTMILRAQMSDANGFVTLAPRRSEWFSAKSISPFIGSLDWYQALAIHEYRHVVQMDYLNRKNINWGYALFGELGLMVLMNVVAPGWYFEGDAVYAETMYTDAGRGRSPRFPARLKALLGSDQRVDYDTLLAGDYSTAQPNHYVYGYFLITRAYNKFGSDIWKHIMNDAATVPINPWTMYNAFRAQTGENFDQFFKDTMKELKEAWNVQVPKVHELYTTYDYPMVDGDKFYFLKSDLDSFWTLYRKDGKKEAALESFNIWPSYGRVDLKRGKFIYNIAFSDSRFSYKGTSDLYLYDIVEDEIQKITEDNRYYQPQINPVKDEILAIEFDVKNHWHLTLMNFEGDVKKRINLGGKTVAEAVYHASGDKVTALVLDEIGMKLLATIDLVNSQVTYHTAPTRNNLYSLFQVGNKVYFEADYKGEVAIFNFDLITKKTNRCTKSEIADYRPHVVKNRLHFVRTVGNGTVLDEVTADCNEQVELLDGYQYLGNTPSDNFQKSAPVALPMSKEEVHSAKESASEYDRTDGIYRPHSWVLLGQGYQVGLISQNMLSTTYADIVAGYNSFEERPYFNFGFAYARYLPIFSFGLSYQDRNVFYESSEVRDKWSEAAAALSINIPLVYLSNLYTRRIDFGVSVTHMEVSAQRQASAYEISDEQLNITEGFVSFSNIKDSTMRQIYPSFGQSLSLSYSNAQALTVEDFSSYMGSVDTILYFPGFTANGGFRLSGHFEYSKEQYDSYRIGSNLQNPMSYQYSRGYSYTYYPRYSKGTLDYKMPLAYPNVGFRDYIFMNRIVGGIFYDHTFLLSKNSEETLNSRGVEFSFEAMAARKLPVTLSVRSYYLERDKENGGEIYIGIGGGY